MGSVFRNTETDTGCTCADFNLVMAHFDGVWKLESSENLDAMMKEAGMGIAIRTIAKTLKPTITVATNAKGFHWKNQSVKTQECDYEWGVEVDDKSPSGDDGKQVWSMEGDKMVGKFTMKADGKVVKLVQVSSESGIKCTRVFKKV